MAEPESSQQQSSRYVEGLAPLLEQIAAIVWTTDTKLVFTSSAGRGLQALNIQPGEVVGLSVYDFFKTTDPAHPSIASHLRALSGEGASYQDEYQGRTFVNQIVPQRGPDGVITGTIGLAVDITDAKIAAESVRRSEAHYRALVEDAPVGIFRSTNEGRFLTVNAALVQMLGYANEREMLGLDMAAEVYADPTLRGRLVQQYQRLDRVSGVDVDWRRKDGSRITVRLSGQPVRDSAGTLEAWEMVAEDVTERRRLEAQLRTAQKMEALGLVTGGVAHDFNNILTTIVANCELIGAALPTSMPQIRSDLLEIQDAAARGSDLVKKLLGFSRRERLTMQPTHVDGVALEMAEVLRRLVPERIRIHVEAEADLPPVLADAGAIQQILLNLATNARDAIAENGDIYLTAGRTRLEPAHLAEFGWGAPGDYVAMVVRDNGLGMDEGTRARAFEPFFTTKPPGAGSGLGLAMVYGLMKQQNGFVGIASAPDQGTTVTLYLPITGRRTPPSQRVEPVRRAGDIVLVVEDEEPIRRVAKRVLERHGYLVMTAADGLEALKIYRENEAKVALILSDVVMPRMGGKALHESLRSEGKQVPMIFMSGYVARGETSEMPNEPETQILAKPWSVEQLLARVREVMGETA